MVKKTAKKVKKQGTVAVRRLPTTGDDFKTAVLLVSVAINVAIFSGWLAVKLSTAYDAQVANFLFN